MYFIINNGNVIFAKYLISNINDELKLLIDFCQIENNNIILYDDDQLNLVKSIFDNKNIEYQIQNIDNYELELKTNGIIFSNRKEVIDYIENNIEPESIKKARLEQKNIDLKLRLQQTEDVLLALMFGS